jgi:hemoglobin-like flavoprotein
VIEAERLKSSWAAVAAYGDQVPLRFYSRLFVIAPDTRGLFPLSMASQRDRFVIALGRTITHIDHLERLRPHLEQLGRGHRRFGVVPEHYRPVGEALLATMADFLGDDWTPELAQTWEDAYQVVAGIMIGAAQEETSQDTAAWCAAELIAHQRRTFDIAVLTVKPERPYSFVPGQSMEVEAPQRPNLRRFYTPANAPTSTSGGCPAGGSRAPWWTRWRRATCCASGRRSGTGSRSRRAAPATLC